MVFLFRENMPSRRWPALLVLGAALVAAPMVSLQAQVCQASNTPPGTNANPQCNVQVAASVQVPHLLQLTTSGTTSTLLPPGIVQYDSSAAATLASNPNGHPGAIARTSPFVVSVKGNRAWQLKISAFTASWSFTQDATYNVPRTGSKPAGDFYWSTDPDNAFQSLTTTGAVIASNPTGSSISYNLYYRVKWDYTVDVPGKYDLTVVYTLIGQ